MGEGVEVVSGRARFWQPCVCGGGGMGGLCGARSFNPPRLRFAHSGSGRGRCSHYVWRDHGPGRSATGTPFGLPGRPPGSVTFVDIGSGVGKLCVGLWLEEAAVAQSVGIEISRERNDRGQRALAELMGSGRGGELRRATLARAGQDHDRDYACAVEENTGGKNAGAGGQDTGQGGSGVKLIHGDAFDTGDTAVGEVLRRATHIYVASLW